ELERKKLLLYAPTFRGNGHQQSSFDYFIDYQKLYQVLGNDYAIVLHLHPYIKKSKSIDPELSSFVYHIQNEFHIEELLVISDLLITDYSSIIFDYSILERPMAFFANDLEEYTKERDFYFPYE